MSEKVKRKGLKLKSTVGRQESISCYLMLLLPILGFLVLNVYPILWTFKWSFFNYTGIPSETRFVGAENFATLFSEDMSYWKSWINTLQFTCLKVPIEMLFALVMATFICNKSVKMKGFFRSAYYLPNVISVAIVGLIFSNLFSTNGFVNEMLQRFGMEKVEWLGSKTAAMGMLVYGSVWNTFGINVLYFIAALSNVPEELYEAASIDGAGALRKFFCITVPMIAPVFQTIILLSLLGTLGVNEYIIVLTGGAPANSTRTVMSYLTTKFVPGFMEETTPNLGYGCAISLMTTIIFGIVSVIYQKASKKMNSVY